MTLVSSHRYLQANTQYWTRKTPSEYWIYTVAVMKVMSDSQSIHRVQCTTPDTLEGKVKGRVFLLIMSKTGSRNQGRWWTCDCTDSHTTQHSECHPSQSLDHSPTGQRTHTTPRAITAAAANTIQDCPKTLMSTLCSDWSGVWRCESRRSLNFCQRSLFLIHHTNTSVHLCLNI